MDPIDALLEEVPEMTKKYVSELLKEWHVMYHVDFSFKEKYSKCILRHLKDVFEDMIRGEVQKRIAMLSEIEELMKEHKQLQKELHMHISQHYNEDDPLQAISESLNKDLEKYREIKTERVTKLESFREKEQELCDRLGVDLLEISSQVPSPSDLQELEQHIFQLRGTKLMREQDLVSSKERIVDMMRRLELGPNGSFEREVCENPIDQFRLTESNMKKLKDVVARYEKMIDEASDCVHLLESRLEKLWNRIQVPEGERAAFNRTYNGIGSSAVSTLTQEIERCEVLKRANMKLVIEHVRKEITNLWDVMTFTAEQRLEFRAYFADTYNEDVLELHEMEQAKLQAFYEKYQDLYVMAEKREALIERMEEFAASAKDPMRYKNRGGQLLKEEKERKSTEVNLHKIEVQLKKGVSQFYNENGYPFLWRGLDLLASMSSENHQPTTKTQKSRHLQVHRSTPRAKENRNVMKRKIGQADETFTVDSKPMTLSSSVDSGINMKQLSTDSLSSYSQFQEHVDAGSSPAKRACTPSILTPSTRIPIVKTPRTRTPRRF